MGENIFYLQGIQIDKKKWDNCIQQADNCLIYAYSVYLDQMAIHWDGLILGDYQAVMPLTWNQKFGLPYLYQPAFTASLGIFGKEITPPLVQEFINAIPKKFKLVEIALNYGNWYEQLGQLQNLTLRNNFQLSLHKPYEELASGYRENTRRNIRKAIQLNCILKKGIPLEDIISLSNPVMERLTNIKEKDYQNFIKLYHTLQEKKKAVTYGVYSPNGQLVSSAAYFLNRGRAYYILVGNHPDGKTIGASHYLIDGFIRDHAGEDLILDFEGSDIRNLAYFYSSFGAESVPYPFLQINHLPFWIKWFKK